MTIDAAAAGELVGTVAPGGLDDPRPALTFALRIPVRIAGAASGSSEATLSVRLMHPQVQRWEALQHRDYRFDASTRRHANADGETIVLDDVFGDLRTEREHYDVAIAQVDFGAFDGATMAVRVAGTLAAGGARVAFAVGAALRIGSQPSR